MLYNRRRFHGETIYPDIVLLCTIIAFLLSLAYWVVSIIHFPHEPSFVTHILARNQSDFVYHSLIRGFSDLTFSPTMTLEGGAEGTHGVSFLSLSIHALSVAIFGAYGYIVADIILFLGLFIALYLLLQNFSHDSSASALVAVMTLVSLFVVATYFPEYTHVFSIRFPRPLVSSIFAIVCLRFMAELYSTPLNLCHHYQWAFLGCCLALLFQADPYLACSIWFTCAILFLRVFVRFSKLRPQFLIVTIKIIAICCGVLLPFFIQQFRMTPEMAARIGLHSVRDPFDYIKLYFSLAPDMTWWHLSIYVFLCVSAMICYRFFKSKHHDSLACFIV